MWNYRFELYTKDCFIFKIEEIEARSSFNMSKVAEINWTLSYFCNISHCTEKQNKLLCTVLVIYNCVTNYTKT